MTDRSSTTVEESSSGLARHIGTWGMLFTGLTGIIGSGWLFAALYAVKIAGPAAIVSWVIGCLMALVLAMIYAELGAMIPAAPSFSTSAAIAASRTSGGSAASAEPSRCCAASVTRSS